MNKTATKKTWPRSIAAVLAGMLTNIIPAVAIDAVLHATEVYPPMGQPMSHACVLAFSYRFVQPGFVRDVVLEQTSGPGRFNVVTLVEWQSQSAMEAAKAVVMAAHAKSGFKPQELFARLGIEADIANYTAVDA